LVLGDVPILVYWWGQSPQLPLPTPMHALQSHAAVARTIGNPVVIC